MPNVLESRQQPSPDHAPVWARFGTYTPYRVNSTDSVKSQTLTNFFYVISVVDRLLGEQAAQVLTHEQAWRGNKLASDGDVPLFTYYMVDRRGLAHAIQKYINDRITPTLARMNESAESKQRYAARIKQYDQIKADANKALAIVSDRHALVSISQHLVVVADHKDETLRHVWECRDLGSARIAVQGLSSAGLPFDGPLNVEAPEPADDNARHVSSGIGNQLSAFFNLVSKTGIKLPAMPEATSIPRKNNLFTYLLSDKTTPTVWDYFAQVAQDDTKVKQLAEGLAIALKDVRDFSLYCVAQTLENGSAHWAFFSQEDAAKKFVAARILIADEGFADKMDRLFGECEAFKTHSQSDEARDFIVGYLSKPGNYSILSAFSHKDAASNAAKDPQNNIPQVLGLLLKSEGDELELISFNAQAVFIELFDNNDHLDKHGQDLIANLLNHSMWPNLIDFAHSLFGESHILATGKAHKTELGDDPDSRIITFVHTVNTYFR